MPVDPELRYSDDECHALFAKLFPNGLAGADVMGELAQEGWENSRLNRIAHPTVEQVYEESVRMHENLASLAATRAKTKGESVEAPNRSDPPSLEQIRTEHEIKPFEPERELRELLGMCLWDIFSDNHEVIGPDGRIVDLGSFRASGGFIAEIVNRSLGIDPGLAQEREMERLKRLIGVKPSDMAALFTEMAAEREKADRVYDYMDFYMGTQMVAKRADISPAYRLIFRRLRTMDCEWRYHFPRLFLVDFRPLRDAMKEKPDEPEWSDYNPSAAFEAEQDDRQRDEEIAETREGLDQSYREAVEAAQDGPPPTTVAAYRDVFGQFPEGWPPQVEE